MCLLYRVIVLRRQAWLLQGELTPKSWTPILTFGGVPMGKYSVQFKIKACKAYINGDDGFRKIANRYSMDCSLLRRWVAAFKVHGSAGLRANGHRYSAAFKRSVVECMRKERLSCREVATRFGLGQSSRVGIWERQYYSGGLDDLSVPKRK
ncbi:hypothetical protein D9M71_444180 [compost metagenome]